jgi:hypothetical protein
MPNTIPQEALELQKKVEVAAGIVGGGQSVVGVAITMEIAGFTEAEQQNISIYQKVRRRLQKLCIVEKNKKAIPPPEDVTAAGRTHCPV